MSREGGGGKHWMRSISQTLGLCDMTHPRGLVIVGAPGLTSLRVMRVERYGEAVVFLSRIRSYIKICH